MTEPTQEQIKSLEQRLASEPQSPLFARLASYYLHTNRANEALQLCDNGLAHFPFYATGHLVKGNVLAKLGMKAEAKHEYGVVCELMPTNELAAKLWSGISLGSLEEPPVAEVEEAPSRSAEPVEVEEPETVAEPAPIEEVIAAPEPTAPQVEEIIEEASVIPEPEVSEPQAEVPVVEEPQPVELPEVVAPIEDTFGIQTEQVVAEESVATPELQEIPAEEVSPPAEQFDFGGTIETPAPPAEETAFGESPSSEPPAAPEDTFSAILEPPTETTEPAPDVAAETPSAGRPAEERPEWLDAFSQLQQPVEEVPSATEPAQTEENPFAAFGGEEPAPTAEAESYEDFSARVRMELFGTENTMSLEDYLSGAGEPGPATEAPDQIGDLAEKLKSSPRITPPVINFSEKSARTTGDVDATAESGFVTPTLAEIYVKQGWYDDAIKAYRTLATSKPDEKEKYQMRIAEIEEMKRSSK